MDESEVDSESEYEVESDEVDETDVDAVEALEDSDDDVKVLDEVPG